MSTRHRWADVITAWANGEAIQWRTELCETWRDWLYDDYERTPHFEDSGTEWRVKPRMCSLNGYEFPAPISEAPPEGATVWLADPAFHNLAVAGLVWAHDELKFHCWLRRGRLHTTRDAAIAHARAEILAVGGTLEENE